jgi:nicotinic acid mononucleotide adenylyltransferase
MGKKLVFAWGRFNPPTTGHGVVIDRVAKEATSRSADYAIFASKTQNVKKDPLSFRDKVKFLKQSFPKHSKNVNSNARLRTVIQVMQSLESKYDEVTMVVGSDRVIDFKRLLAKYDGKEYKFQKIDVVSAGERDPDAEDVSGMSASKMRAAAQNGDYKLFKTGTPLKNPKKLYDTIRKNMNLSEDAELLDELSKTKKALAAAAALALYNKKKKKKKDKKVIDKPDSKDSSAILKKRLMSGAIGGPRFMRLLRFGLVDSYGDIPMTKRAFKDLKASQSNPQLREKVYGVIDRAFEYLLHDDILYKRLSLLLYKQFHLGESNDMKNNYVVSFSDSNKTQEFIDEIASVANITWASNDILHLQIQSDTPKQHLQEYVDRHDGDLHKFDGDIMEDETKDDVVVRNSLIKISESLKDKSIQNNIPYDILVEVYARGLYDWTQNETELSQDQWAYSRINSFISNGASRKSYDVDLWDEAITIDNLFEEYVEDE